MKRVLLLIDQPDLRHQLENRLEHDYLLIAYQQDILARTPADLLITDFASLKQRQEEIQQWRDTEPTGLIPLLLILTEHQMVELNQLEPDLVDEVIFYPGSPQELEIRLNNLIRLRYYALECKHQQEQVSLVRKAIDSSSDAILITDMKGRMLFCNPAFLEFYSSPNNSALDTQGILEPMFVHPETGYDIMQTVRNGRSWNGEVELHGREGQSIVTLLQADTVKDDDDKPVGIVSVYTNVTEHRRMKSAEAEQRTLAEALRDTATTLTSTLDLTEVFERILTNVGRVVPHDAANIMIIDNGVARVIRSRGYTSRRLQDLIEVRRFPVDKTPHLQEMAETRQTVIIPDMRTYPNRKRLQLRDDWPRSYAGAPIWLNDEVIGFINLESDTPDFFKAVHADRLRAFAEQAAIAIQNARLYEQSQTLAALQERQRLGRDLHDSVSQTLFSATMIAEALPRLWERDQDRVRQQLNQLHRLMRGALAETRTFLLELRPDNLRDMELEDLLRQLAQAVWGRKWIEVSLEVEGDYKMPLEVKLSFYRVAQEALANVVKHARATHAEIHLKQYASGVELVIKDNGRGFDPKTVSPKSMGLRIMREHADEGRLSFDMESVIDRGTQVKATWISSEGQQ